MNRHNQEKGGRPEKRSAPFFGTIENTKAIAQEILETLPNFQCNEIRYELPICRTHYTCGIKYLVEKTDASWLLADASVYAKNLSDRSPFIVVDYRHLNETERLEKGWKAVLEYSDGNGKPRYRQYHVEADFPLDELRLYFVNGVLMLPTEH